jgi:hypothetical protein
MLYIKLSDFVQPSENSYSRPATENESPNIEFSWGQVEGWVVILDDCVIKSSNWEKFEEDLADDGITVTLNEEQ